MNILYSPKFPRICRKRCVKNNMGFAVKQRPGDGTVLNYVHVGGVVHTSSCCLKGLYILYFRGSWRGD